MTIYERALELVPDHAVLGLGSGRASLAFVYLLGEQMRAGKLRVRAVATSEATAAAAVQVGIPLVGLDAVDELAVAFDGADEVAPNLDLIKGYGRALVREKIVAAAARQFVLLVGDDKLVPQLGARGKLPVEVVPFALPLVQRRLRKLGLTAIPYGLEEDLFLTDNGNHILDCHLSSLADPARLEQEILQIPGVVDTGLFLKMADVVLVGDRKSFRLLEEKKRS